MGDNHVAARHNDARTFGLVPEEDMRRQAQAVEVNRIGRAFGWQLKKATE